MEKLSEYDGRFSFHIMDATNLSCFSENLFSGAYICAVLEHLPPEKAHALLKEVRRVVAPSGLILINEAIMEPDESLTVQSFGGCPPFLKEGIRSLIKMQSKNRGDANFGEEKNMKRFLKNADFENFTYEKKPLHNLHDPEWQQDFQAWFIDIFDNVFPILATEGGFSKDKLEKVKEEILSSKDIMMSFGSVRIENTK